MCCCGQSLCSLVTHMGGGAEGAARKEQTVTVKNSTVAIVGSFSQNGIKSVLKCV